MSDKNIIRCSNCRKVLAEGIITNGNIEIKCKCGTLNTVSAVSIKNQDTPFQNRMDLQKKDYNHVPDVKEIFVIRKIT